MGDEDEVAMRCYNVDGGEIWWMGETDQALTQCEQA